MLRGNSVWEPSQVSEALDRKPMLDYAGCAPCVDQVEVFLTLRKILIS